MFRIIKSLYPAYPANPVRIFLLEADLQSTIPPVADGFGEKVFFFLQGHVDDAAFGRVEDAKGERTAALADLISGKACHGVQLGLSRLPKSVGIDDKAVFAVDLTPKGLK